LHNIPTVAERKGDNMERTVQWGYNDIKKVSHAFVVGPLPANRTLCGRVYSIERWDNCAAKCKICQKRVLAGRYSILHAHAPADIKTEVKMIEQKTGFNILPGELDAQKTFKNTMTLNPYTVELLESRFKESDSLVEHILIACDFIEFQVNRMLSHSGIDMKIVKELNFTPEQRFSFALASSFALGVQEPEAKCPEDFYYFWGRLNEAYNLRRVMRNLTPAQLDERVKRLYHVGKFDKNAKCWQAIIDLINAINESAGDYDVEPIDLWDPFVITLYDYLLAFADGFVGHVTANEILLDEPDEQPGE